MGSSAFALLALSVISAQASTDTVWTFEEPSDQLAAAMNSSIGEAATDFARPSTDVAYLALPAQAVLDQVQILHDRPRLSSKLTSEIRMVYVESTWTGFGHPYQEALSDDWFTVCAGFDVATGEDFSYRIASAFIDDHTRSGSCVAPDPCRAGETYYLFLRRDSTNLPYQLEAGDSVRVTSKEYLFITGEVVQ